ncbi:hypothetical protein R6Q59_007602 [Mikania micrantha]
MIALVYFGKVVSTCSVIYEDEEDWAPSFLQRPSEAMEPSRRNPDHQAVHDGGARNPSSCNDEEREEGEIIGEFQGTGFSNTAGELEKTGDKDAGENSSRIQNSNCHYVGGSGPDNAVLRELSNPSHVGPLEGENTVGPDCRPKKRPRQHSEDDSEAIPDPVIPQLLVQQGPPNILTLTQDLNFPPPKVTFFILWGHDILMAIMLNGAVIMDGLLIAANESCPQPQTFEHMAGVEIMRLGTIADGALVIPVSAQVTYNIDVFCQYIIKRIPISERNFISPPNMIAIRSFDVNNFGFEVDEIKGGVASGSILKVNKIIEVHPGIVVEDESGNSSAP